ncbi:MAG: Structural maintenance of chromosomes protein 3 [Chrysothrix sp. TS-e1954]|nr:MAG: Structural maintenance of chromosomes protein 3 [Chrysothrix sp. TS-e1954]
MHIKQIIIQGFKSYKDQTVIEPFSPKNNVIVGRNGTGKSNFFAAIRFVLSDAYNQMGREERQALLHEGSGSAVMSAYVEIIFDNSDERFPTGKDELILRRTIGLKKDEYSIDRKNATKTDVKNFLESAGFSPSNPYYIVPQGRVTTLTNMKDADRMILLKKVAGTETYEERRAESVRIMAETDAKREKINDLLTYINDRLGELEEEKEELRAYQDKDRERRCLQYTIYHREQQEANNALENLEIQRDEGNEEVENHRERFLEGEKILSQIEGSIRELKQQTELLLVDKRQFEDERKETARARAKLELSLKSMTEGQSAAQKARAEYEGDLQEVQASIEDREKRLAKIMPEYERSRKEEDKSKIKVTDAEGTRQRLFAKQGRSANFKNQKERDSWLQKEVDDVNVALATRKAVMMQTTEEIQDLQADEQSTKQNVTELRRKFDGRHDALDALSVEAQKAREARDRLQDQRKELWREEAKLDSVLRNSQAEYESAERFLSHMTDQNTRRGLETVRRLKRQQNLQGLHGTLAELFEVNDRYKTAVEVTGNNSLFHYVVDNDEIATKLSDALYKDFGGRVTFMPLNRLGGKTANFPKGNDAIQMISKLQYDPKYEKAMKQVFGKTIICPNLQIASQYARSHGINGITPDGDTSDKKGKVSGGYNDPRQSRLDAVRNVSVKRNDFEEKQARKSELRKQLDAIDQQITRAVSDLQKTEQRSNQTEGSYVPLQQELHSRQRELESKVEALEAKQRSKDNIEVAIRELSQQQSGYEEELASEFKKALTQAEENELESTTKSLPVLKKQHMELSSKRAELEAQKSTISAELRENLKPRLDQLKSQEHESSEGSSSSTKIKERQRELKQANKKLEDVEKRLRAVETEIDGLNKELADQTDKRASKHSEQEDTARSIERFQKRTEKSMAKRSLLTEKAAEATRNIRDLGVLPEEAFDKYAKMSSEKAIKRLHETSETLKKYSHVNKKAFEQYRNFTSQRETLNKRRGELDSSQKSIRDLIEVLDQRKDEAIERTFKQVSKEFATIFERLVPAGRGRLIIQRKSDKDAGRARDDSEDEEDGQRQNAGGVENYTGVGISVSFNSRHDEQQRIQQLSGGQKSLCALALVFAIQQCDPAPFYLFDEIDANLDAQYRTAVAALLKDISNTAQFICTTFRSEMVLVAEKCYGVMFANRTSGIDVVTRDDALGFVEGVVGGQ